MDKDYNINIPTQLSTDCDYFHDERDSEYAPLFEECCYCYKYKECLNSYLEENI